MFTVRFPPKVDTCAQVFFQSNADRRRRTRRQLSCYFPASSESNVGIILSSAKARHASSYHLLVLKLGNRYPTSAACLNTREQQHNRISDSDPKQTVPQGRLERADTLLYGGEPALNFLAASEKSGHVGGRCRRCCLWLLRLRFFCLICA